MSISKVQSLKAAVEADGKVMELASRERPSGAADQPFEGKAYVQVMIPDLPDTAPTSRISWRNPITSCVVTRGGTLSCLRVPEKPFTISFMISPHLCLCMPHEIYAARKSDASWAKVRAIHGPSGLADDSVAQFDTLNVLVGCSTGAGEK